MEMASQLDIKVIEEKMPFTSLSSVDGIFITGTIGEIYPIESVLEHSAVLVQEGLPLRAPHPVQLSAADCKEIWHARNLELVWRLRREFDARLESFREGER